MATRPETSRWWGDMVVAACACVLTVAVVGSAVYLGWRIYDRRAVNAQVKTFVTSLQNRTADELQEQAAQLKAKPKVARYVLPELRRTLRTANSEQQVWAAIQIAREFVDDSKIRAALFRLRRDPRESVAAAAVEALGHVQPPEEAVRLLGQCVRGTDDAPVHAAVVDEACGGLVRLGEMGRAEMRKQLDVLTADRRVWVARYVGELNPPDVQAWLNMLGVAEEQARPEASASIEAASGESGRGEKSAGLPG